ncbi:MAG: hypothetical protein ACRBEQ_03435 [Hyphomonas sp.]
MKKIFGSFVTLAAVACCTPVTAPEDVTNSDLAAPLSTQSVEDKEMAATRALRSGKNTYAQTCGPLRKKLDARQLPAEIAARIEENKALIRDTETPRLLQTDHTPLPPKLSSLRISVVCNVVSDLSTDGISSNQQAICSDDRFKAHAEEAVSKMRWVPFTVGEKIAPLPGMVTKWEFCTND